MLSKNHQKLIISLRQKKFRALHKLFVAEGTKIVMEAIAKKIIPNLLFYTSEWLESNSQSIPDGILISEIEMKKISSLKTPPGVLAVFNYISSKGFSSDITLVLDNIQDPGNLGTMIRTAHAFDCKRIICSKNTVDCYNPKTVQSSMGSIFHIDIEYLDLEKFFDETSERKRFKTYSFDLNGNNIYNKVLSFPSYIILGNESNGVRDNLDRFIDEKLRIPISQDIDSLNVGISQAIALAEFNRVKSLSD